MSKTLPCWSCWSSSIRVPRPERQRVPRTRRCVGQDYYGRMFCDKQVCPAHGQKCSLCEKAICVACRQNEYSATRRLGCCDEHQVEHYFYDHLVCNQCRFRCQKCYTRRCIKSRNIVSFFEDDTPGTHWNVFCDVCVETDHLKTILRRKPKVQQSE